MSWLGHGSHNVDKHLYQPLVNDEDPSDIKQPPVKSSGWGVRTVKNFLAILMFWRSNSQPEEFTPVPEKLAERSVTSDDKPAERSPVNQATHASMVITRYLYPVEDENHPVRFPDFTPAPTSETVVEIKEDVPRYYVKERAFIRISDLARYGVNMRYLEGVNTLPEDRTDHVFNQQLEAMAWIDEYIQLNGTPKGKQLQKHIANVLVLKQAMLNGTLTDMPDKEYKTLCRSARHCGSLPFNQLKEDANRCQHEFFKVSGPVKEDDTAKSGVQQSFQATTLSSAVSESHPKAGQQGFPKTTPIYNPLPEDVGHQKEEGVEAYQKAMENLNLSQPDDVKITKEVKKSYLDDWNWDELGKYPVLMQPVICTKANQNENIEGNFSHLGPDKQKHLSNKYIKAAQWVIGDSKKALQSVKSTLPEGFFTSHEKTLILMLKMTDKTSDRLQYMPPSEYKDLIILLEAVSSSMDTDAILYE